MKIQKNVKRPLKEKKSILSIFVIVLDFLIDIETIHTNYSLSQCFSTGVPWACIKGSAAIAILPKLFKFLQVFKLFRTFYLETW